MAPAMQPITEGLEHVDDVLEHMREDPDFEEKDFGDQEEERKISSDASTLKGEQKSQNQKPVATSDSETPSNSDDTPISSENTSDPNSEFHSGVQTPARPPLEHTESLVQVGRVSNTKWSKYPGKGYKTTTKYFYQEIDSSWTAIAILACYFTAGVIDSVAYATWAVFVNLQTGNTIFIALRVNDLPRGQEPTGYVKSLTSMGSYWIGALFFNTLHRIPAGLSNPNQPLHRWTLLTSFGIQSVVIVVSAILAQCKIVTTMPATQGEIGPTKINYFDLIPIGLMGFDAAGQVCISRALSMSDLPTIVLSTIYHDLIANLLSTKKQWKQKKSYWNFLESQKKQVRRLSAVVALFMGAYFGGLITTRTESALAGALWLAAAVKIVVIVAWCFWPKKTITEEVVVRGKSVSGPPPAPKREGSLMLLRTKTQRSRTDEPDDTDQTPERPAVMMRTRTETHRTEGRRSMWGPPEARGMRLTRTRTERRSAEDPEKTPDQSDRRSMRLWRTGTDVKTPDGEPKSPDAPEGWNLKLWRTNRSGKSARSQSSLPR